MEGPLLLRLTRLLEERGVPIFPVLEAVNLSGAAVSYLMVSALSLRIDMMVPFTKEALAAVAPSVHPPELPPRAHLKISALGEALSAHLIIAGAPTPRDAVAELAPSPAARNQWLALLESLPTGGKINQRLTSLTDGWSAIAMAYDERDAEAEATFLHEIEPLVRTRRAWPELHATLEPGAAVSIATRCAAAGPTSDLGFLYGNGTWDQAVTLCGLIADAGATRSAAAALGALAAAFDSVGPRAIEIVYADTVPTDVITWVILQ